jgi:uncharacterized protein YdaU (DUF1376 family)
MNFYKHHIGDYDADTAHLTWDEDMAYTRMMRAYYRREKPLPAEIKDVCRLVRATTRTQKEAVETVLNEFFTIEDDGWHQKRCDEELSVANEKADQNRQNGKKGGRPRKVAKPEITDSVSDSKPKENPDGFESKNPDGFSSLSEKNLSQTPDARLQTPDINPLGGNTDVGGTPRATVRPAELSAAMRRHSIEAQPGDPRIIAAAAAGITPETVEAACAEAKASDPSGRIKAGFVIAIAQRWTADAAKPPARSAPRASRDEQIRAISEANGAAWLAQSPESDPNVIDMEQ